MLRKLMTIVVLATIGYAGFFVYSHELVLPGGHKAAGLAGGSVMVIAACVLACLLVKWKRLWMESLERRGSAIPAVIGLVVGVLFLLALCGRMFNLFNGIERGNSATDAANQLKSKQATQKSPLQQHIDNIVKDYARQIAAQVAASQPACTRPATQPAPHHRTAADLVGTGNTRGLVLIRDGYARRDSQDPVSGNEKGMKR